jgi:curved DNA-binding protein CbpA
MRAQLKDYYKILELHPAASPQDIKKAYRRLAFKYHPDTNSGNFAETHFREIQEAYDVLVHTDKRRHYDEERWLAGMGTRAKDQQIITPYWILKESQRLGRHMAMVDTYRMSHSALHDYIFMLLSDSHMAILQEAADTNVNHHIVKEILTATKNLRHLYMEPVGMRIAILAGSDNTLLQQIQLQVKKSHHSATWERYMPLFIVVVAIVLCVLMWWWAR